MRGDHVLINLGNHRPELSLVVQPLQYEISSFQDLAFILPEGIHCDAIEKSVIYCDDIDLLTKMFWWFHSHLEAMGLPSHYVDILNANLSAQHEQECIERFRTGETRILLGTEKIGAGLNLPGVACVVQYLTKKGLTLAKLEQRRGRGARTKGTTAIGYLLFEPELLTVNPKEASDSVDADVLALIQTEGCYQAILDRWLDNPPRLPVDGPAPLCCSYCHPSLLPAREFMFIMVDADLQAQSAKKRTLSKESQELVYEDLCYRRQAKWEAQWRHDWPRMGPRSMISDDDLRSVAKAALNITSIDDFRSITRIAYWQEVTPWLLDAVREVVQERCLTD